MMTTPREQNMGELAIRKDRAPLTALGKDQEDHEEFWGGC